MWPRRRGVGGRRRRTAVAPAPLRSIRRCTIDRASTRRAGAACAAACLLALVIGCTPFRGVASTTLMTRSLPAGSRDLELVGGPVEESETSTWAIVFLLFGVQPTHESVVDRLLEKHGADVLLDAELTSSQFGIPYVFFWTSTTAKGQPARYKGGRG